MQRSIKANSPYMVKNIIPQPSFVYLAAYLSSSLYMANAVTGEDAGEALKSELACAASIARLAGMDPQQASGVFTFGGTGTNLYALKNWSY
jgi:L-2,4-diaminobutyrate decarboxylase